MDKYEKLTAQDYETLHKLLNVAMEDTSDPRGNFYTENWANGPIFRDRESLRMAGSICFERRMTLEYPNHHEPRYGE